MRAAVVLTRLSLIGITVGSLIIAIGAASLVQHLGVQEIAEENTVEIGDAAGYTIPAPPGSEQVMEISGESFTVTLAGDVDAPLSEDYQGSAKIEWTHADGGDVRLQIRNTGSTVLDVTGMISAATDPTLFTFDLMVMISGIVIIGFSMGFTLRRPKGF